MEVHTWIVKSDAVRGFSGRLFGSGFVEVMWRDFGMCNVFVGMNAVDEWSAVVASTAVNFAIVAVPKIWGV